MREQTLGDKPNFKDLRARNDETVSIPAGTPVAYKIDGTEDGLAVIKPSSSAAKNTTFFAGVLLETLGTAVPKLANMRAYGIVDAVVRLATRGVTSDSWTSLASQAIALRVVVDTINDCFLTSASAGSAAALPLGGLAETIASQAASATATGLTLTVKTTLAKVFIRAMG